MPAFMFFMILVCFTPPLHALTLSDAENFWRQDVVRLCEGFPSKQDCDDGDSVIFNGLLCMVGEQQGCETVRASQDADGRFWRSPRRNPGNLGEDKSFSRDQTLGVLLYLAKTQDRDAALRWMAWIEDNRYCGITNPLSGGCTVFGYRVCRDDKEICDLRPGTWALFHRVWEHLGLPTTREMRKNEGMDISDIELIAIDKARPGYELHLKAVAAFLRMTIGSSVSRSHAMAQRLHDRQEGNPFFQVLAEGPSEELSRRLLQLCPKPGDDLGFRRYQWAWERDTANEAWRESMGWDCIFMGRLLDSYSTFTAD
ncbi:MAG TPA: hypothetical protein VE954_33400 [Oligoflexus sp.]|uniref:hypothetical protein n=1 Tax=Oligoflexus sp. TaxID=1971216 RepID=UPI002D413974|nr:hypothetical protein [Oligoflexus sp.]HYX38024.1 hypothetical protein [Oligoflexus sp.]